MLDPCRDEEHITGGEAIRLAVRDKLPGACDDDIKLVLVVRRLKIVFFVGKERYRHHAVRHSLCVPDAKWPLFRLWEGRPGKRFCNSCFHCPVYAPLPQMSVGFSCVGTLRRRRFGTHMTYRELLV